jgi:hypothetical protein
MMGMSMVNVISIAIQKVSYSKEAAWDLQSGSKGPKLLLYG